jgi:hypothetical protein
VPPNIRRFLPIILIVFFLLFLLPQLLKKKSTSSVTAGDRATQTIDAMNLIDKGEQAYSATHGGYTAHLADLVATNNGLAKDLVVGIVVQLDAGSDRKSFVAQVESDVLSLIRARSGNKLIANSCVIVKSGSGVACPAATALPAKS